MHNLIRQRPSAISMGDLRRLLGDVGVVEGELASGFIARLPAGNDIAVEQMAGLTESWLLLRAAVCSAEEMEPRMALERCGSLGMTALVLIGHRYWLRTAVPCDSKEAADLPRLISLLVAAARSLSPVHNPVLPNAAALFAHYAD